MTFVAIMLKKSLVCIHCRKCGGLWLLGGLVLNLEEHSWQMDFNESISAASDCVECDSPDRGLEVYVEGAGSCSHGEHFLEHEL